MMANTERGLLPPAIGIAVGVARLTAGSHISAPASGWCDEVPRLDTPRPRMREEKLLSLRCG
jgi:hypothetical protein